MSEPVDIVIGFLGSGLPDSETSAFVRSASAACRDSGLTWLVVLNAEDNIVNGGFSRSAGMNKVIRTSRSLGRVLVLTDADIRFSGTVLKTAYSRALRGRAAWFPCRNTLPNGTAKKAYRMTGRGSLNAATLDSWYLTGGYEELMTGWGSEDVNMHNRFRHRGIPVDTILDDSVLHLYHPPRLSHDRAPANARLRGSVETDYLGDVCL